jgi:hypothetical protein
MKDCDISEVTLLFASKTRSFVIEQAITIEDSLTSTISTLLDINSEQSKSFGFGSESLSFNQKILLMQDKNGIPNDVKMKLEVFMHIRNKFAHVKSVDSFENYFKLSKGCLENKKRLDKWFKKPDQLFNDDEIQYKTYFYNLSKELFFYLINILSTHLVGDARSKSQNVFNEKFLDILQNKTSKSPISIEIWNETISEVLLEIKKE